MTASGPDPVSMSVAEKLACEWEARHDVVARGGRLGDPAAVAHYCTHTRSMETAHPHAPHLEPGHHHGHAHAHPHGLTPEQHLRSWLRWGEDGR